MKKIIVAALLFCCLQSQSQFKIGQIHLFDKSGKDVIIDTTPTVIIPVPPLIDANPRNLSKDSMWLGIDTSYHLWNATAFPPPFGYKDTLVINNVTTNNFYHKDTSYFYNTITISHKDTQYVYNTITKVTKDTVYVNSKSPVNLKIEQQPDQMAAKGQYKFVFKNLPDNDADFLLFKNGSPVSSAKLNVKGQKGYQVSGNTISIPDANAGDIIHLVQLR